MSGTNIYGKTPRRLEELPIEIKGLIMEEVSLLPSPYNNLLNLAQTCKQLSSHAISQLYLNDVRDSMEVDPESNMPLILQWACWFGALEAAKMSLEGLRRAGVDVKCKINQSFKNETLYKLRYKEAKKRGPSGPAYGYLHWGSRSGLLHLTCLRGNIAIAALLIEKGADPDALDGKGLPPLAYSLNEDVVKFLIENGANVNVTDDGSGKSMPSQILEVDILHNLPSLSRNLPAYGHERSDLDNRYHTKLFNMVYLKTSQEWLDHSMALLEARPLTTRITTSYKITPGPTRPDADGDTVTKPSRGSLVLKTFDPISGVVIKYRTTKAQEVTRLIHASLGRLGRSQAAVPDVPEVTMADAEGVEEPQAATSTPQAAQGGGGGKKKKKGKK
ncbi:unnamed protein product [Fusarium graminearum]|uniref:Uncharacterized protein n=1 Tax=Gibberella zeae TaxID=5518 RepID=A0A4U9ESL8_GIBZA|nr:unnamed protein product [Fusarium graminearum]CAF3525280.1 unnamed protein product [Fusarium graminearum]CAG1979595.1 unnamed protein product [Fusarium graminearum]VTO86159.1 unnamed protein product [Fusarium graminearum]